MAGPLKSPVRQCDLIFYCYVHPLNYQKAKENKRPETMACSNSTANTLVLCEQDNVINTSYAVTEQGNVQLKLMSLSG